MARGVTSTTWTWSRCMQTFRRPRVRCFLLWPLPVAAISLQSQAHSIPSFARTSPTRGEALRRQAFLPHEYALSGHCLACMLATPRVVAAASSCSLHDAATTLTA
ncbi:hypothetical protein C8Q76DRAFT_713033 [Earliella scabrosa]|nr:hypothetical protein C8Q76DRAFT_713033 [Earliella scabrosa]